MAIIEAELEREHEQLMRDREAEIASLKQQIERLDTLVTDLQQQQQQQHKPKQQGLLAALLSCNCPGGSEDEETEHAIEAPE